MPIAIYTHADCLAHDTGAVHPECKERLEVILAALKTATIASKLAFIEAPLAEKKDLLLAHDADYIDSVFAAAPSFGRSYLDADTVMSPGTLPAALRAAGAAIAATDAVLAGQYRQAFCAMRPPGHHATRNQAMGFCIFNSIAIAAFHALQRHGLSRVAIVDFDVHHGNGTQDIISPEPRILYISTHQSPLYPGTGQPRENQKNHILNLPLLYGTGSEAYRALFADVALPALETFAPQLLLVSAGFDAHRDDPLAGLQLVEEDYRWLGQQLAVVANRHCGGKMISFLEGGYNLDVLGTSVAAYVGAP